MRLGALTLAILASLVLWTGATAQARNARLEVDGVHVTVPQWLADGIQISSQPGDATQETTVVDRARQRTFSIIAVPYGSRASVEDALPVARKGGAGEYRTALHDYRVRNGQYAIPAPVIGMFGSGIQGEVSERHEDVAGIGAFSRDALTSEWVAEAGSRIWIVRFVQYIGAGRTFESMPQFVSDLGAIGVSADATALAKPTTVHKDAGGQISPQPFDTASPVAGSALDTKPAKYSDPCDVEDYDAATGFHNWRNYLGASYRGIPACGPRPATGGTEVQTTLAASATWPVSQFDSVELSLRWMYLAYDVTPFAGNGDQLYGHYERSAGGRPLTAVAGSGATGYVPHAGDVLSYDTEGSGGHTSLVVGSRVDPGGDGWVDVMEQNASYAGYAHLPVVNHTVLSNYGGFITGWLTPHAH
jgi:hypothetical protein